MRPSVKPWGSARQQWVDSHHKEQHKWLVPGCCLEASCSCLQTAILGCNDSAMQLMVKDNVALSQPFTETDGKSALVTTTSDEVRHLLDDNLS